MSELGDFPICDDDQWFLFYTSLNNDFFGLKKITIRTYYPNLTQFVSCHLPLNQALVLSMPDNGCFIYSLRPQ